jgi:hypothetical protein
MNPQDDLLDAAEAPADDGIALMTELVAAVTWLRRGAMPDLTVWDACEQALRTENCADLRSDDNDPLRSALLGALMAASEEIIARTLDRIIQRWLDATSLAFNESTPWV